MGDTDTIGVLVQRPSDAVEAADAPKHQAYYGSYIQSPRPSPPAKKPGPETVGFPRTRTLYVPSNAPGGPEKRKLPAVLALRLLCVCFAFAFSK